MPAGLVLPRADREGSILSMSPWLVEVGLHSVFLPSFLSQRLNFPEKPSAILDQGHSDALILIDYLPKDPVSTQSRTPGSWEGGWQCMLSEETQLHP